MDDVKDAVVAEGVTTLLERVFAADNHMMQVLGHTAVSAAVRQAFPPALKIDHCWQSVQTAVEDKGHNSFWQVIYGALPSHIAL